MTSEERDPGPGGVADAAARSKREWDARAKENARWAIASGEDEGLAFSLSGLRDAVMILEDLFPHLRPDMRLLEIGCGIGRLLQAFALVFDEVWGVDASPEMLRQARELLDRSAGGRASVFEVDGATLAPIADGSVDLVVSYAVLQHLPDLRQVQSYVAETHRVLRPGGLAKLHVKTGPWEHQQGHDTWHGVEVSREDWDRWNAELGFELLNAYSLPDTAGLENTAWIVARKPSG